MATGGPRQTFSGDHVKIKDLHGNEYPLPFSENTTVRDIKQSLLSMEAFSHLTIGEVRIICQGRVLKDASSLLACGVKGGHVLHVVEKRQNAAGSNARPRPSQTIPPATALANDVLASMGFGSDSNHTANMGVTEPGTCHTSLTYSESVGWQWGTQHPTGTHPPLSTSEDTYTTMEGCLRRLEAMNRHTYGGGAEGGRGEANVQYVHRLPVLIGPQLLLHARDTASALSRPNPPWLHPPYENRRRRWSSPRPGTHPADTHEGTASNPPASTLVQDRLANQIALFAETTATYEPVLDLVATLLTSHQQDGQGRQPIRSSHQRLSANGLLADTVRYLRLVEAQAACLAEALGAVHVDEQGMVAHSSTLPEPTTLPTGRLPLSNPHLAHSHQSFTAIDSAHFERAHEDAHAAAHSVAMEAARQSLRGISRQTTSRSAVVGMRFRQHVVANQNAGLDGGNVSAGGAAGFSGFRNLGGGTGGERNGVDASGRRGVDGDIVMSMETTTRDQRTAAAQQAHPPAPAPSTNPIPTTRGLPPHPAPTPSFNFQQQTSAPPQPFSFQQQTSNPPPTITGQPQTPAPPPSFNFQTQRSNPPPVETADITETPRPPYFSTLNVSPQTTSTRSTSRIFPAQTSTPQISTNPFEFTPAATWGQHGVSLSIPANPTTFQPPTSSNQNASRPTNQTPAFPTTANGNTPFPAHSDDDSPPPLEGSEEEDGTPSLCHSESEGEETSPPPSTNQATPPPQAANQNTSAGNDSTTSSRNENTTPQAPTQAPGLFQGSVLNFRPSLTDILMRTFGREGSGQGDGE